MKERNGQSCAQEHELIGFVYGELNETEAVVFQRHLNECAACSAELSGFRDVRQSVVAWRNESLGNPGLPADSAGFSPTLLAHPKPSALAAVREFLNLSPLWMKGAVALVVVVFCVLAVLAVARLQDKQPTVAAADSSQPIHSQREIDAIVKQRVQDELARIEHPNTPGTVANPGVGNSNLSTKRGNKNSGGNTFKYSARRPLSKTEREQLATDLRLVSSKNDGDLYLLEDRINQ